MPKLLLLISLLLLITPQAVLAAVNFPNPSPAQFLFVQELQSLLSPKLISQMKKDIYFVSGKGLNFKPIDFADCSSSSHNFGNWFKRGRGGRVYVNPALLSVAEEGYNDTDKSCRHKTQYEYTLAAFVYLLAELVDRGRFTIQEESYFEDSCGLFGQDHESAECSRLDRKRWRYSQDPKFLALNFDNSIFRFKETSLDSRLWSRSWSAFAVSMEYFLLDEEFSCRRPVLASYLRHLFGGDGVLGDCLPDNFVEVQGRRGRVDLEPSKVSDVSLVMVGPGKELISRWGHVMLLLKLRSGEQYVASYYGDSKSQVILSGFNGKMKAQVRLYRADERFAHYKNKQQKLSIFPLQLSFEQKLDLTQHLLASVRYHRGRWNHLANNCVVNTWRLLKATLPVAHVAFRDEAYFPRELQSLLVKHRLISR